MISQNQIFNPNLNLLKVAILKIRQWGSNRDPAKSIQVEWGIFELRN